MGLNVGDVVKLTYESTYNSQRIIYVLHYRVTVPGSSTTPEADLASMSDNFANNVSNTLTAALQNRHVVGFNFDSVVSQRVHPAQTISIRTLNSFGGQIVGIEEPANVSVVLSKRTLTPGKRGRGSLHLSGVDGEIFLNGVIDPLNVVDYNILRGEIVGNRTVPAVGMSIEPGLFNPTLLPDKFSPLFEVVLQTTVRVMRRRTVRVGI